MKPPKLPSVKHLPWSEEDARRNKYLGEKDTEEMFEGKRVVLTEKLDGATSCITKNKVYARSRGGEATGRQFDMLKKKHAEKYDIPEGLAVYGEWLYAKHSIKYSSLPSYFMAFEVYDMEREMWLSRKRMKEVCERLGIKVVPVIESGRWENMEKLTPEGESKYGDTREGYVVRVRGEIEENYVENSAKCVREDHVSTEELHWKTGEMETNYKRRVK